MPTSGMMNAIWFGLRTPFLKTISLARDFAVDVVVQLTSILSAPMKRMNVHQVCISARTILHLKIQFAQTRLQTALLTRSSLSNLQAVYFKRVHLKNPNQSHKKRLLTRNPNKKVPQSQKTHLRAKLKLILLQSKQNLKMVKKAKKWVKVGRL